MTRYTLTSAISIVLVLTVFVISPGWAQKREPSLRQLQEAVKNNPNDPRLHYLMGLKYQNEGSDAKALKAYQKAVSLNHQFSEALLRLGALKSAEGDQEGAVKALKKAVQLDPKNKEAKALLGSVYGRQGVALMEQGKNAEAIKVLQLAVTNKPEDDAALNNLGVAFAAQGDLNLAAQAFQQAIRANPANDNAHFNLGYTNLSAGDRTGALDQYAALTALGSGYGGELFGLLSFPKGYPVDTPYSPPQWGQTTPYKALPAAELPSPPSITDALRDSPDLQIPSYGSAQPGGQLEPSSLPGGQLPGAR